MPEDPVRLETLCASAREGPRPTNDPLVAPIYQAAVGSLASLEQCLEIYAGKAQGFIYTRDSNPNHTALESVIAQLDHAEACVAFGSGMAALAATLTALTGQGRRVAVARQLYGATVALLESELSRFGVETVWFDVTSVADARSAADGAAMMLVETIANPLTEVADVPALAEICRAAGVSLVVDHTFASPYCSTPLDQGAQVVVHSITKWLGGHSDLTLGCASADRATADALRRQSRLFGGAANPFEAWLALRGIATFPLRMQRCCENAVDLAARLAAHPAVVDAFHPSLPTHPQHALAAAQLRNGGPMLAFTLADAAAAAHVLRRLRRIRFAPSLGDVATTVSYPTATSHRALTEAQRVALGITPGTIRVSAGIDHIDDVWDDFSQALDSLT